MELRDVLLQDEAQLAVFVRESGFLKLVHKITVADIPSIVEVVCTEYAEILQFKEGLSILGVSELVEKYPRELEKLLSIIQQQ